MERANKFRLAIYLGFWYLARLEGADAGRIWSGISTKLIRLSSQVLITRLQAKRQSQTPIGE